MSAQAHGGNVNLRLGPEEEILAWLVIGPFPNPTDEEFEACEGFETDHLASVGGEKEAAPSADDVVATSRSRMSWTPAAADVRNGLDFLSMYKTAEPGVAYAYAAVVTPSAMDARLLIGSDDGVKAWVNGDLVHTSHRTRGVKRDEETVGIRLNPGTNRLLFKVDQHYGGWGLMARVVGRDGSPASGLLQAVEMKPWSARPAPSPMRRILDRAIGRPGSLDMLAVADYLSWERKIRVWTPWLGKTSDGADVLEEAQCKWDGRLRSAAKMDADKYSLALRGASLALESEFDAAWDEFAKEIQSPEPLVKADPAKEDYIRVADGGRYFVRANGEFFTPIGYNHNPEWTPLDQCAPGFPQYDPEVAERFFRHLRDSGVNLIRMMVEFPVGGQYIEKPLGTFRPEHVAWLDCVVTCARKHDIKLMITPWDTYWMNHRWDVNPYNAANGGPVEKKADFITGREAIEAQKRRWEFIIDRWGNLDTVFAWELLNESDYWWGASPEQVSAWAKEMGDFVRRYEKEKWGRNHLVCISTGRPIPDGGWGELAYETPGMDLATTHLYLDAANAPDEPIGPALAVRKGVSISLSRIKDNRPYIDGENGPINRWIADESLDNDVFHNMVWAHMSSGGAGSGLRWPYRGPHHLTEGMYQHLSRMSKFAKDVPWRKLIGTPSQIEVSVPEGWVACSTGTSKGALVWIASPEPCEMKLSITWNGPETVRYRCYGTRTGEWFAKGTAESSKGEFAIPLSGERDSVAVVLE